MNIFQKALTQYKLLLKSDFAFFTGCGSAFYGAAKYTSHCPEDNPFSYLKYGFSGAITYGLVGYLCPPIPYIKSLFFGARIEYAINELNNKKPIKF